MMLHFQRGRPDFRRLWRKGSPEFRATVGGLLYVALGLVAAAVSHHLTTSLRAGSGTVLICAGSLMAIEPLIDLFVPKRNYIFLGPETFGCGLIGYYVLGFVGFLHSPVVRVVLAAALFGTIPIGIYALKASDSQPTPASEAMKRRFIFLGVTLIVVGSIILINPE
jgi:hypothetical protein